jgi:hypothetical protein
VVVISELINYVGESVITDTRQGISVNVHRKCTRHLIQDGAFMIKSLTGINLQ